MDRRYGLKPKRRRRKRLLPYRKWSDTETTQLIEYMKNHVNSRTTEKPCARVFYTRFVEKVGLDANWFLVKNKVRNLREKFLRAVEWKASVDPKDESIPLGIRRMCPYFEDLEEVFGERNQSPDHALEEPQNLNYLSDIAQSLDTPCDRNSAIKIEVEELPSDGDGSMIKIEEGELEINGVNTPLQTRLKRSRANNPNVFGMENTKSESDDEVEDQVLQSKNECYTNATAELSFLAHRTNSVNGVAEDENISTQLQKYSCACFTNLKELTAYQKEVIDLQKTRLTLDEQIFLFEKEKTLRELELKKQEIEKDERLKIYEIESKERIAMKELEYKYVRKN